MKKKFFLLILCFLLMTGSALAAIVTINLDSEPGTLGGNVAFNGTDPGPGFTGSFVFNPTTGNNFEVTTGTAVNHLGSFTGTFDVGTITTSGITQSAPVTGPGTMTILDGATPLVATVQWVNITTVGAIGGFNLLGTANVTGLTYAGSNADLKNYATYFGQNAVVSFQFGQVTDLTDAAGKGLMDGSNLTNTSWSGTLSANSVPIPPSALLLGSGLLGLVGFGWRRKRG